MQWHGTHAYRHNTCLSGFKADFVNTPDVKVVATIIPPPIPIFQWLPTPLKYKPYVNDTTTTSDKDTGCYETLSDGNL
jgi:hypothetical protein